MSQLLEASAPALPAIRANDAHIQYWGRWDMHEAASSAALTVNTGSTIIVRFAGANLTFHFATSHYTEQFPSLWLQVDDGEWKVVQPAESLAVASADLPVGTHTVRLVVKGFREWENRWDSPLVSSVVFRGLTPAEGSQLMEPPERPNRLIEYLGDSITEGVLVLAAGPRENWGRERWPEFSDGRRTWAYQSALLVAAEPRTVGFGRLGLTINSNGGVPPAIHSFPFIHNGVPIDNSRQPDIVVINQGTNDWSPSMRAAFGPLYQCYVAAIRQEYPQATILCLRPFNGSHAAAIQAAVAATADAKIHYVDTTNWIDPEKHTTDGVHLNLEGNRVAAEKMAAILRAFL